jgi:hypothetical protein
MMYEQIIAVSHIVPGLTIIAGLGVLVHAAYFRAGIIRDSKKA